MMYLSKIVPTRASLERIHHLRRKDGDFWEHRMIWNLFDNRPEQRRDFLYRREDPPGTRPFYYLLSRREPARNPIEAEIQTQSFAPALKAGDVLQFALRANAVVTRKADDHSKRRIRRDIIEARVDAYRASGQPPEQWPPPAVIHQEAAQAWMERQGGQHGFECGDLLVSNRQYHKIHKPGDGNRRHFTSLDLQGQLVVTDPEALQKALENGLGRAKAFGCGLLLVRRA